MHCPHCLTECAESSNFCPNCGRPLTRSAVHLLPPRQVRWEFTELTIPLEANSRVFWEYPEEARARFDEVIRGHIERASLEGWLADEATDFDSLKAAGRLELTRHRRFGLVTVYSAVTIRLKRVVHA